LQLTRRGTMARRWAPEVAAGFTKASTNLALEDIRDSVRELQYYRERLFAPGFAAASRID
jgi:oligoribonuclease (3'-5' exoribonuclease)